MKNKWISFSISALALGLSSISLTLWLVENSTVRELAYMNVGKENISTSIGEIHERLEYLEAKVSEHGLAQTSFGSNRRLSHGVKNPEDDSFKERLSSQEELDQRQKVLQKWLDQQSLAPDNNLNRLMESGFTVQQSEIIAQKEEEMRLEEINREWHERRLSYTNGHMGAFQLMDDLEADLGENAFENYMQTKGFSKGVKVVDLISGSAGEKSGLLSNDKVVRYDGRNVYNEEQLIYETLKGRQGELVQLDVMRGGEIVQLFVERGPLGITDKRQKTVRRILN